MIKLSYNMYGDIANPPILFLHGFLGNGSDWESICTRLSDKFYCITLDLPGHGKTDTDSEADYSIDKTSSAIIKFLESQNIINTHLVGYSLGGRIAFYLAVHASSYFSKIILESTSPGLKTEAQRNDRALKDSLLVRRLHMQPFDQFIDNWYEMDIFKSLGRDVSALDKLKKRRCVNSPEKLSISLTQIGTGVQPSLWEDVSSIRNNCLCITGSIDKKYTGIAKELIKLNSNFAHTIVDDCGHNVHFEKENYYINTIRDYLIK